ncbi:MAG: ADP-ribosylglycohydrolase family protein [Marinicellaceae bacterium]
MESDKKIERFKGCLIGLVVGDAIGTTVEFEERGSFEPLTDMVGGGPFNLKAGQWTDDTSMALCLAHSLIHMKGFDATDQMNRYCNWYNYGYMSSTGECFDIGHTTLTALRKFLITKDPMAGSTHPRSAGNGGIMRLAPIPMFYASNISDLIFYAGESSKTTHAASEAVESAQLFATQIQAALMGQSKYEVLSDKRFQPAESKVIEIQNQCYINKTKDKIQGTGYVIDSLEAALWCFYHGTSFEETVLMAANLGDDADTTAAVAGQIAGAYYGYDSIPEKWLDKLAMKVDIFELANNLFEHGNSID